MSEREVLGLKGKDFGKAIETRRLMMEGRGKKRKGLEFENVAILPEEIQDSSREAAQVHMHPFKMKNFRGEHGRWRGDQGKVLINIFDIPMRAELAQDLMVRVFQNREHPCEITYEPDVLMGGKTQAGKVPEGSHSLLWREDLSDSMIGWIRRKVQQLDDRISQMRGR